MIPIDITSYAIMLVLHKHHFPIILWLLFNY
jgi:hypothetical protein